jgi:hypothetical protein
MMYILFASLVDRQRWFSCSYNSPQTRALVDHWSNHGMSDSVCEQSKLRRRSESIDMIQRYVNQTTTTISMELRSNYTITRARTARSADICSHELTTCALPDVLMAAFRYRYHLNGTAINRAVKNVTCRYICDSRSPILLYSWKSLSTLAH